ncbi:MAG: oligosaccharide flippase family protein [Proteobacteria bacterium]|nr:oligosaccharide flippase family protein [Pseudomonadota bacterium]
MRRLLLDITWYGGGDLIAKLPVVLTLPIFTRFFGPEEFGALNLILAVVSLLAIVISLGNESTYARYFFAEKNVADRRIITGTWLIFIGLFSVVAVLGCLPFSTALSLRLFDSEARWFLIVLALLVIPPTLINGLCGQILRNVFRARAFVILNVVSACLIAGFSLAGVFILELGLVGVIGGTLAAVTFVLPLWLLIARPPLTLRISLSRLAGLVRYGVSLMLAGLAYWVFTTSDRLMLGWLADIEAVGLYSAAATIVMVMGLLIAAFGRAWWPRALELYETDAEQARNFFSRIATYLLAGFGMIAIALALYAREIIVIVSGQSFAAGAVAIPPLAFAAVAFATTSITSAGMTLTKRVRHIATFSWLAAVLNIGLNLILIPRFLLAGAAWASFGSMIFLSLGYFMVSQRLWRVRYEYRRLFITITLIVVFAAAMNFLPVSPLWMASLVKLIYLGLFAVMLALFGIVDIPGIARNVIAFVRS